MTQLVDTLRLGIWQVDPEQAPTLGDLPRSLDQLVAQGARVLVLPELWNAGFEAGRMMRGALNSEDELEPLLEWSQRHPEHLLCPGSLALRLDDGAAPDLVNRSWLLQNGRILARYDKLHLFGPMGEARWIKAGHAACLCEVEVPEGRVGIGLGICYDLRFPELFRHLACRGAELILVPSQWPRLRHHAFHHLLWARAMENGISVAGVNRRGRSGGTGFDGGSAVYGMGHDQVFLSPDYQREFAVVELDLRAVRQVRSNLDAVADCRFRLEL